LCGIDMPGSAEIQAKLRAEFRKDGSTQARAANPSRYFFAPLEPLEFAEQAAARQWRQLLQELR
ncbi:hypothetical protein G8O24_43570, partial [Bradyrhizobium sp. INPA01-394B]|nr:hypothetical protein [Bradyrhizobium campsiandrae]